MCGSKYACILDVVAAVLMSVLAANAKSTSRSSSAISNQERLHSMSMRMYKPPQSALKPALQSDIDDTMQRAFQSS